MHIFNGSINDTMLSSLSLQLHYHTIIIKLNTPIKHILEIRKVFK